MFPGRVCETPQVHLMPGTEKIGLHHPQFPPHTAPPDSNPVTLVVVQITQGVISE